MRYIKKDSKQYIPEKKYIDTMLIPLIPIDPANDQELPKQAFLRELNQVFTAIIEKEYRGRIFLSPDYYYLNGHHEKEIERLNEWIARIKQQPFQHIFLFTFDAKWRKYESKVDAEVIWVPGLGTGDLQSTETQSFIKEQAREISEFIQSHWS
ncbi:DUF2487 family protein [Halobacillus fulvus]|nr:DUF2487 family protein [Halobacillus fulvus]